MPSFLHEGQWVEIPDHAVRLIREVALSQAVEAVKALPLRQSGLVMCVHQQSALAAIESLSRQDAARELDKEQSDG